MGDLEHDATNTDHDSLRGFVERLFNLEKDFEDVKAEYKDATKDLKAEIKSRVDETGVNVKQVVDLVKIRLNEQAALEEQEEMEANMELYRMVYGFAPPPPPTEADEEDDAADGASPAEDDDALG